MSGPKADAILSRAGPQKKKKKRKADEAGMVGGYLVKDEDGGWGDQGHEEADEEADVLVASDRSFKKRKAGEGWETVRDGIKAEESPPADEQPTVVETEERGGLLTAAQVKKKFGKKEVEKVEKPAEAEETVYRDSSGRKIDTKAARAEAARLRREQEEREAKKMEWGKGLVQRGEEERRKLELEKEKARGLARYAIEMFVIFSHPDLRFNTSRYADDKELNEDQKAQQRWNDPAAAFLTVSRSAYSSKLSPHRQLPRNGGRRAREDRRTVGQPLRPIDSVSSRDTDGMVSVRILTSLNIFSILTIYL